MTIRMILSRFALCGSSVGLLIQAQEFVVIVPVDGSTPPSAYRLVWAATPGRSYEVRYSADLLAWNLASGTPLIAERPEATFPVVLDQTALFFRVDAVKINAPEGMVLIPAGPFEMGDSMQDWPPDSGPNPALPVHTVQVSGFYMDQHEVTQENWEAVRAWAVMHGYTDLPPGGGKVGNHPVTAVSWFEVVKWSNARSEKAGVRSFL